MTALEVARHYFALSNQRDLTAISDLFSEDATYSSDNTGVHYGRTAIMSMVRTFFTDFPELHWTVLSETEMSQPEIIQFKFRCAYEDAEGNSGQREGLETMVIDHQGLLRHVEERNL